jgi:DNA-binding MarR family transcriptional regulator
MQREGWVRVAPGREDKRSREISLTKKGVKQLEQAVPLWQEAQRRVTQALGDSRLERMLGDLTAVVDVAVTN